MHDQKTRNWKEKDSTVVSPKNDNTTMQALG